MTVDENNGWRELKALVLSKLDEHGDDIRETRREVSNLTGEFKALKVKAGAWGAVAGAIPAVTALALWLMSK